MKPSRYSTSRQKACQRCASAKARCDRRSGGREPCSRCMQRGISCSYVQDDASERNPTSPVAPPSPFSVSDSSLTGLGSGVLTMSNLSTSTLPSSLGTGVLVNTQNESSALEDVLDFSSLDLLCPINADDIQNRWIQAYIPMPGQAVKNYPDGVRSYIYLTLRSYSAMAVSGRGTLPFIHPKQMIAQPAGSPLTTCLSLVRICSNQLRGSSQAAVGVLRREIQTLDQDRAKYTSIGLFAAFQSYLIYSMVLFFILGQSCDDDFRAIMTSLQELACASSRQGLICAADQRRARPKWEEWIITEAKRRTLYVMYLFDSILSSQEGLPTFLGTELRGLPAPASKLLWQAGTRYEWEREYNVHMADWMEGCLTIDELWPTPDDLGEVGVARRRARVDQWLQNLDEYGTMLFAIMRCTHGD
ncbi:Zn(II)2Cys6 transcription factor domain-containing protein [Aspergillus tubingensis]|uniref:Zn(II)2Cys6 transcription factor domain-containing protein n=1 Tax=Aspergillus tubingensis TaxID=5068 RepID=UPI0015782A7A|nr:C6 finger domain protein [Aspergillus tubingensis]GFN13705.1 C6 finger domain protein [Aspergillus tubingensis]